MYVQGYLMKLCSVIISEGAWRKSFLGTTGSRMRFNLETRHVQGKYVSVCPCLLYFLRMAIRNIFILMKICIISLHSLGTTNYHGTTPHPPSFPNSKIKTRKDQTRLFPHPPQEWSYFARDFVQNCSLVKKKCPKRNSLTQN